MGSQMCISFNLTGVGRRQREQGNAGLSTHHTRLARKYYGLSPGRGWCCSLLLPCAGCVKAAWGRAARFGWLFACEPQE